VVGDFRTHDGSQRRHCFLAVSRADSSFTCISRSWCVYMVIKAPPDCFSGRHTTAWAGSQTRENDARALGYLSTAEAEVHGKLGFFRDLSHGCPSTTETTRPDSGRLPTRLRGRTPASLTTQKHSAVGVPPPPPLATVRLETFSQRWPPVGSHQRRKRHSDAKIAIGPCRNSRHPYLISVSTLSFPHTKPKVQSWLLW